MKYNGKMYELRCDKYTIPIVVLGKYKKRKYEKKRRYIYKKGDCNTSVKCPCCKKRVQWSEPWRARCGHIHSVYEKEFPHRPSDGVYTKVFVFHWSVERK